MSASLIWKRCRLDDEVNRLTNYGLSDLDKAVCRNARTVLDSTNCFKNDVYSLPPGVDSKVRDLYPLLQQIQAESRGLSDYDLEKMAQKINFTDIAQYEDHGSKYMRSCEAPFNHTYFPDYNLPSTFQTGLFDPGFERSFEREFKTPASIYRQNSNYVRPFDTSYGLSTDRRISSSSYFPSGNLFNASTYRSQLNTPGYGDFNRFGDASNFLATPNNLNYNKDLNEKGVDYKIAFDQKNPLNFKNDSSYKGDLNFKSDFDYKNEFLTAFQPGNEYRNDYTTVETPVAASTRRNVFSDDFVSSFPWEKNLNNYFNPNSNEYFNNAEGFGGYDGPSSRRMDAWSDVKSFGNFNPNSPLRSMLNEEASFHYHPVATPQRPYY